MTDLTEALRRLRAEANRARATGLRAPEVEADPGESNLWIFPDGRLCFRTGDGTVWRVQGSAGGAPTSSVAKPADPSPTVRREVYRASWGRSFCRAHGVEDSPMPGYGSRGQHDDRRVMIGFAAAAIRADLAGRVVRKVELSLENSTAAAERVELRFGAHGRDELPSEYSAVRFDMFRDSWPASGGGSWRALPPWFGRALASGEACGLTVDQPRAREFSGSFDLASVKLAITSTG